MEQYVIHNGNLIYYKVPVAKKAPTLDTSELKTGKFIKQTSFAEGDEWDFLDVLKLKICLGRNDDIYLCTPNGIYGGKLNQKEFDLLMTAKELGYTKDDYVYYFGVGWEGDFYLLHGTDAYGSDDGVILYHFIPE